MIIKFENFPIFNKKEYTFGNGINFFLTTTKDFQHQIIISLNTILDNNQHIFINDSIVNYKSLKKHIYYVNVKEKKMLFRNMKFKSLIKSDSDIIRELDIESELFDLRLKQLWHRSYICSCAIGIKKGKKILIFPWINAKECSVQSYRIKKLYDYSKQHDLIVIIPTESIEIFKNTIIESTEYTVFE